MTVTYTAKIIHISEATEEYNEVYIGRAGRGKDGYFGNPIIKGKLCDECGQTHTVNGSTLPCYRIYLTRRLREDEVFRKKVRELSNKVLVCFCTDKSKCHGTILTYYIGKLNI